jgi:hypothetical protein
MEHARRIGIGAQDSDRCCAWSPDGRWIAYTPDTDLRTIVVATPSGRRVKTIRIDNTVRPTADSGWRRPDLYLRDWTS